MKGFDFEEERIKQEITKLGAKRVLLQLPEGLKPEGPRLAEIIEKTGALPIISADPCYGACDIAVNEAESLGVDLIVHFGHSKLVKHEQIPTIYVEARATVTVEEAVEQSLPLLEQLQQDWFSNFSAAFASAKSSKRNFSQGWKNRNNRRQWADALCWASHAAAITAT